MSGPASSESETAFIARHADFWAGRANWCTARGLESVAMWVPHVRHAEMIEETRTLLVYVNAGTSSDEQHIVRGRVRNYMLATIYVLVLPWHSSQTYP